MSTRSLTASRTRWFAYLASPQWAARRMKYRLAHPDASCKACGSRQYDLHHLDHARSFTKAGLFAGRERDSDLIPLCRRHHDMAHRYWNSRRFRTRRLATLAAVADVRSAAVRARRRATRFRVARRLISMIGLAR